MKYICEICQSFYNPLYSLQFDELIKQGVDCRVFYFTTKRNKNRPVEREYVEKYEAYSELDRLFFFIKEHKIYKFYIEYIKKNGNPILNHAHTLFTAGYVAYQEYVKNNIPYIVTVRNVDINHFFKKRIFLRRLGHKILNNASVLVFLSNTAKKQVLDMFDNKEEISKKAIVITNGIDSFWIQRRKKHQRIGALHDIKAIYYGDINSNKNIISTVKALEILKQEGFSVDFTVVGKLKEKKLLKYLEREFVHLHEYMDKEVLIEVIRKNDIFIMPSYSETFGLAYLEAMSQGLPVIYSKGQGFDGLFNNGTIGFAVNPNIPESIAEAIKKIDENYNYISNNAFQAVTKFNWENIAADIKKIYESCLMFDN